MRFSIQHETSYRYTQTVSETVQLLRLTPRAEAHQRIVDWQIDAPARLQRQLDAFGNVTHMMALRRAHDEIVVKVRGVVELSALNNGELGAQYDGIPVLAFGVTTALTQPDEAIMQFVQRSVPRGLRTASDALLLASMIADQVDYLTGVTQVSSTAAQAFALGRGVCQDHAHIFLACCRVLNVPARYVSGYVHPGTAEYAASHAWVDVWLEAPGWVSVDVTNRQLTSDRHCRLAVARDYESAAPIRGVRVGGGQEDMRVSVTFHQSNQ
jgi:transglutaminase-like putative cysteine protease